MKRALLASAIVLLTLATAATAQEPATIWKFLGIPKVFQKIRDATANSRGNRPGLERTPPLKKIADPAFLKPEIAEGIPMPKALKEAAKVKIQEDLAPQKIKAVKFLAEMGCGCYNDDGAITDALVEALEDCTPDVREATIVAISEVAADETCTKCGTKNCCEEPILMKLAEIAYERDETGCYKELNEDIRNAAIEALEACCPSEGPLITDDLPESILPETPDVPEITPETPETPDTTEASYPGEARPHSSRRQYAQLTAQIDRNPETLAFTSAVLGDEILEERPLMSPLPPPTQRFAAEARHRAPVFPAYAVVEQVDGRGQVAFVRFQGAASVPVGSQVEVFHKFLLGVSSVGRYEIIRSSEETATIRPLGRSRITSVSRGDEVKFRR
jgi:hypothetical protein